MHYQWFCIEFILLTSVNRQLQSWQKKFRRQRRTWLN
nr:unnamed protein product [Callosobruchus analis]